LRWAQRLKSRPIPGILEIRLGLILIKARQRFLSNGALASLEGCSVISDNNGKMLFYTNGLKLINRKHVQMMNGDSLKGDLSSTSNAVIIPIPDNDSIYYVFTVGAQNQSTKGFRYSIVNMKGDRVMGRSRKRIF